MRSLSSASTAARQAGAKGGSIAENWISVESWYVFLRYIGFRRGSRLQRLAERYWYSSR